LGEGAKPSPLGLKLSEIASAESKTRDTGLMDQHPPLQDKPPPKTTGLVYDVRLLGHTRSSNVHATGEDSYVVYPEVPERIRGIYLELRAQRLVERCTMIQAKSAEFSEESGDPLLLVHSAKHVQTLEKSKSEDIEGLKKLAGDDEDIFFTPDTANCARLACGGVIEACRAVLDGLQDTMLNRIGGFCHVNNVAVAVKQILSEKRAQRILIVDWDVHH
ncbi:Polyamine deacetylase hdac10, partial [Dinochytrium kinnereticum]